MSPQKFKTSGNPAGPEFSLAGVKLAGDSGMLELMDDLGRAETVREGLQIIAEEVARAGR